MKKRLPTPFSPCGFTLLEVLIAMAILAAALVAILNMENSGLIRARRGIDMQTATMLANQKMTEVILALEGSGEFPEEKGEEGTFEDEAYENYRWTMKIRPVTIPLAMPPGEGEEKSALMELGLKALSEKLAKEVREVRVAVYWKELSQEERSYELVTHLTKL